MTTYPSMDQYNDAVQHPQTAFSDPILKSGKVAANGFGIPIALGGGFALTYTVTAGGRKYAVRCFHKAANGLEDRYAIVSRKLAGLGAHYFVGFEYQPAGVSVNGQRYPIVKMDWVEGETLGTYLETYHADKARIQQLRDGFRDIEKFLRQQGIAHGDIQNGNVVIGRETKLIDYDGVYVPGLPAGRGNEIGHRHFQHPKRAGGDFGPAMDRFSFIVVDLSFRALVERPSLFKKYSNGENIVFTAGDFADPAASPLFQELRGIQGLSKDTENLAQVCAVAVASVPALEDFLAGHNIPAKVISLTRQPGAVPASAPAAYIGAYDVLDALNFEAVLKYVGDRIELIGQITDVKADTTRHGLPYVFLNFGHWRGRITKINVWSEGLAKLPEAPTSAWVGRWISVTGLVDAPYTSRRHRYTHLSITITEANQLRFINETEAKRRLGVVGKTSGSVSGTRSSNEAILVSMGKPAARTTRGKGGRKTPATPIPTRTSNQDILDHIRRTSRPSPTTRAPYSAPRAPFPPPASRGTRIKNWLWLIGLIALIIWLIAKR